MRPSKRGGVSWLEVKLGLRMLIKHPALTLVGGLGLAVGMAISVGFFSFTGAYVYPTLPLDEGERIVAIENRDLAVNNESGARCTTSSPGARNWSRSRTSPRFEPSSAP